MTDRRKRLIKYLKKKDGQAFCLETDYPALLEAKSEVVSKFTCAQLEELLYNSTKNVAQEIVLLLIPDLQSGVLGMMLQKN